MTATNAPASNIKALTGVRFWAALMVVLFHFAGPGVSTHDYLINPLIARGSMGVDLFFILSGYIIHHVYNVTFSKRINKSAYRKFISFRVARMYPVHVFTLALMYILYVLAMQVFNKTPADNASYQLPAIVANLLMVHAWFSIGSPNIPAWSISAEWFMYLLYPLLACGLYKMPVVAHWFMLGVTLVAVHFLIEIHPLLHILPEFILGATLYQLNNYYGFSIKFSPYTSLVLLAFFAGSLAMHIDAIVIYVIIFSLLIITLTSDKDFVGQWLSSKYCIYLGEISYSLYMIHSFIWSCIKNSLRIIAPSIDFYATFSIIVGLLVSVIAASLVYHGVEVSGRKLIRRLAESKIK